MTRPNLLVILIDDLRAGTRMQTPYVDRRPASKGSRMFTTERHGG